MDSTALAAAAAALSWSASWKSRAAGIHRLIETAKPRNSQRILPRWAPSVRW